MKLLRSALFCTFITTLLMSCSSDEKENEKFSISENKLTLHYEETEQITANATAQWSSENEFIAKVNNNGLVEGNHVGKTNILATSANGSAKCEVEITPVYSTYKDPFLEFGASKSAVKSKETRSLFKEESESLAYEGENSSVQLVLYSFDDNKLKGVAVALSLSCASEVAKFLIERYQVIGETDGVFVFINGDTNNYTMGVTLSVEKSYLAIIYLPQSADGRSVEFDTYKEELKSLLSNAIDKQNLTK